MAPGFVSGGLVVVGGVALALFGSLNQKDHGTSASALENSEFEASQYKTDEPEQIDAPADGTPEAIEAPPSEPTETLEPTPSPGAEEVLAPPSEVPQETGAPEPFDGVAAAQKGAREAEEEAARIERADREKMERYATKSREVGY